MLTYSFANTGSDNLYQHLYKCIRNDVIQGVLRPGQRLPSKRSFARNLGISTITVENAYMQLISEGYIYSVPRKGYYVSDLKSDEYQHISQIRQNIQPMQTSSSWKKSSVSEIHSVPETKPVLETESGRRAVYSDFYADLSGNHTSPDNFPFATWARLMRQIISNESSALMKSPPSGGIIELRQAIADHLKQFRGMEVSPGQIIVGAGTEYLYGQLIQLIGHDKVYAVENPGYRKIARIYESNAVACRHINVDQSGINISELENSDADVIHISPAHHFPLGTVTPVGRRYEILAWASRSDCRYVIEDDYDSEYRFRGKPVPSLYSIDVMEKVIYMNTFSKSLASTIRISYMVLPEHLVKKYQEKLSFYACTVSNFEQYTLAGFISEGYFEKHINRMRTFYHRQRDLLLEYIKGSRLAEYCTILEEDAGLHFLLKIDTGTTEKEFMRMALQEGVRLEALSGFYVDEPADSTENIYLVNYSNLDIEIMKEAVDRIAGLIGK